MSHGLRPYGGSKNPSTEIVIAAEDGVGVGPLPEVIAEETWTARGARGEALGSGSITGVSSREIGDETMDDAGSMRLPSSPQINHNP